MITRDEPQSWVQELINYFVKRQYRLACAKMIEEHITIWSDERTNEQESLLVISRQPQHNRYKQRA